MELAPFLFAAVVGFSHCFEADHLVAVSSIVTRRNNTFLALKDGAFWGLGHTSTILLVATVYMLGKFVLAENDFRYFEAAVGFMLIVLGTTRLIRSKKERTHGHLHAPPSGLAYGVGLVHGLAGSGGVLISVLTQVKGSYAGILYILLFGVGSIAGMMLAAGIFSLPFSAKLMQNKILYRTLTIVSSLLCIGLGSKIFFENTVSF
ncbi:urease accessory protein [Runella aurantiaca]|uniref:Urease accessory protein n=1 Tax=Runella aurantiaca TaxID=2282308 RepID=A0A369IGG6_9BACT|nr:urease accessory protein [Runella aurantiaca]RDB06374.1 urease accessory protein [Runella aurantiaca]